MDTREGETGYVNPFAVVVATVRMVGELVFVQRYVNAIVDGWDQAVISLFAFHLV